MRISGSWTTTEGEVPSPVVRPKLPAPSGGFEEVEFLIDTGAEHTVLASYTVRSLELAAVPATVQLAGVGGTADALRVTAPLHFTRDDGATLLVTVACFAFAGDNPLDASVLGRDVLNLFGVVVDFPGKVVCLLTGRHRYVIQET